MSPPLTGCARQGKTPLTDEQGILPENRPSHIRLGKFLGRHYERVISNVRYYRGVQLKHQAATGG